MGNLVSQDVQGSYDKLCKELLENDPQNESGLLHWASPPFKDEQLAYFNECLSKNTCLKRLVLRDLDSLEDTASIAKSIQAHPALTCLGFNGRLPKKNFQVFVDAFTQSATLTEIEIENSIIHADTVDGLVAVLGQQQESASSGSKLTSLALKGCQLDASELTRLTDALKASKATATTLKSLEITLKPPIVAVETAKNLNLFFQAKDSVLEDIKFSGFLQNALPSLLEGAKGHPYLKSLSLEGIGINDDDSFEALAQLLMDPPTSLATLNLSSCNLTSDCGVRLAEALQSSKSASLTELYLAHNSLKDEGIQALSKALQDPASPFRETLKVLDLRMNQIGTDGIAALAKSLETFPSALQKLHLGEEAMRPKPSRQFDEKDVQALTDVIKKSSVLCELHLEEASFDEGGFMQLLEAFTSVKAVKGLFVAVLTTTGLQAIATMIPKLQLETLRIKVLDETKLEESTGQTILENLEKNSSIRQLSMSDVKGPNAAVWKSLEPKIKAMLADRSQGKGEGNAKRSLDGDSEEADNAKRARND